MKMNIFRAFVVAIGKVFVLSMSFIYCLDVALSYYGISFLPPLPIWYGVPFVVVFFTVSVVVLKFIYRNNNDKEKAGIKMEMTALSNFFFDIAWISPINLCALITAKTGNIYVLYIGIGFGILLLIITKAYCAYQIICEKYSKNESNK